jgi:hypothetical protein
MEKLRSVAAVVGSWLLALVIVAVVFGVNFVLFIGHPWW